MKELCELAGVSRSGYYKWRKRDGAPPDAKREETLRLVKECHEEHPSHGYRWVHAYISQREEGFSASADYVRRCFGYLGISAETRRKPGTRSAKREARDPYPNLIFSTWETVDRLRQVIVSDMTACRPSWWLYLEIVFYFDVFTKQIVGCGLGDGKGGNERYYSGRDQAVASVGGARMRAVGQLGEGCGEICVFHTDQGSVYTSMSYNEAIKEAGIVRSCSRAGKPTDNPVNESLNGWIKEELLVDFRLAGAQSFREAAEIVGGYVKWYNSGRPCWALGYMTPDAFYEAFMAGEVERRAPSRAVCSTPRPSSCARGWPRPRKRPNPTAG